MTLKGVSHTIDSVSGDLAINLNTDAVTDKNEILFGDGATTVARMGVGGTAGDIITGSQGQDFNIRTAGGGRAINFSTDDGASEVMKIDTGNTQFYASGGRGFYIYAGAGGNSGRLDTDSINTSYSHNYYVTGTWEGAINVTTSGTAYTTSSDYRLKENVVPMTGSIDRLKELKPSRFNFKAVADKTVDGFLAHEAQEVVPESVVGTKDAMMTEEYEITPAVMDGGTVITEAIMGVREVEQHQSIDQSKLVPLLVASLQEAVAKIEALEARVTALEV
jgi:hypothetical protein